MKKPITLFIVLFSIWTIAQEIHLQKIDVIVTSKVGEKDPGVFVGVVKNGTIIYEGYRGLANLQHRVPVDQNTRSNIASTAKQFTALMVLQLSLEGKLSLEDDIRKYLPNLYPAIPKKIRIRHLLNHTSGIRDYVELLNIKNQIWWKQVGLDNDDVIALLEKQEELNFTPGSRYAYSNSGYNILAKIIAKVTGEKFTAYSKNFFEGLGMNNTAFVERYMGVIPNKAEPYADWGSGAWFQSPTVTKTAGEGFLFTTLKDQLIYEQALQNAQDDDNILLIKSQQPIPNSEIKTYGYGLRLFNWLNGDRAAVHHDGGTYGYNSQTVRFTKEKLTVFVMSNNGNIRSDLIADEVANILLPELEHTSEEKLTYDNRFYDKPMAIEKSQILGQYIAPEGSLIRIVEEGEKTYYKKGNNVSIEILPENKNRYAASYDPKEKIVFYGNKMIIFYPSGDTRLFKKSSDLPASFADLESLIGTYYSNELEMSFELKLTEKNKLEITVSNRKGTLEIDVLNRNELLASNFVLKVQRDQFDSVTDILVSLDGAKNNRFKKKTNLQFQPKIETENGSIQVTTIGSENGDTSDILLTANYTNGNEIWSQQFGGNSYDKASSIMTTDDGYLIIGSTSSYGKGNYDMFVIKTNKKGKKLWQKTYGGFYNEYGYAAEKTNTGYLIKGTIQKCSSNTDVFNRTCVTNVWFVTIDEAGNEISNKVLEEIEL